MSIYNLPNMSTGIDNAIVGTAATVSIFPPMFLVFIFLTVLISGSKSEMRRTGGFDLPMWTVMASVSTLMVTLLMSLSQGLIQPLVLNVVVGITVLSGVWYFFDRNRNEI